MLLFEFLFLLSIVFFIYAFFLNQLSSLNIFALSNSNIEVKSAVKEELKNLFNEILSDSPILNSITIKDSIRDFINMKSLNLTKLGERSVDIVSVDYLSNGKTLNATLWLLFPFREVPASYFKEVDYGMFIDADFNSNTGFGGIDYKIEIQWNNKTKNWTYVKEKWSDNGSTQTIEKQLNFSDFFSSNERYVKLFTDLKSITLEDNYRILFYSNVRNDHDDLVADFTGWITIPEPKVIPTVIPDSLAIIPGQQTEINLRIDSLGGYHPIIDINIYSKNIKTVLPYSRLEMPPSGVTFLPVKLSVPRNVSSGLDYLSVSANFSLPQDPQLGLYTYSLDNNRKLISPPFKYNSIIQKVAIISILKPLTFIEEYGNLISIVAASSLVIIPTLISLRPPSFIKKFPILLDLNSIDILQINVAVIAGVLIFLSLEGFEGSEETQVTLVTANIVFPFAISSIVSLTKSIKYNKLGIRMMVAGFINLIISVILIAIMKV